MEIPLLLVGDRFHREQAQEENGAHDVTDTKRARVEQCGECREGDEEQQDVLVDDDEEDVEQRELPGLHALAQNLPAVVLPAGLVATLPGEVEGEACAPQRDEHGHDVEPNILQASPRREHPDVNDGDDRPYAIDPGGVFGGKREHPAQYRDAEKDPEVDDEGSHVRSFVRGIFCTGLYPLLFSRREGQQVNETPAGRKDPSAASSDETSSYSSDFLSQLAADTTELSADEQQAIAALPAGNAILIVRRGPSQGSRFLLDVDVTVAGRATNADIFLDDVTVSRKHAEFVRHGNNFSVKDLGSLNGTFLEGERISGEVPLADGAEVQVGKFRMSFFASREDVK